MSHTTPSSSTLKDATSEAPGHAHTFPYLFVALECDRPFAGGMRLCLAQTDTVVIGRGSPRAVSQPEQGTLHLRVPGNYMSGSHGRLTREGHRWTLTDSGSRNGSYVNGAKVTQHVLQDGDILELGHTLMVFRAALAGTPMPDVDSGNGEGRMAGLLTLVPQLSSAHVALQRVAQSSLPVLLLGESGTGKEVTARAVHQASGRGGAFVPVNCAALAGSLLESLLFGHIKGAFTGALKDEPGFVRASDKGTLFLDEIGDLPLPAQAALLRVLQEQEVVAVGSTRGTKVDLRVVAATHRALDLMGARGQFRMDLYARLAGSTIHLTPLRDRREDLGVLMADILAAVAPGRQETLKLTPETGRLLMMHGWPLNIRELHQALALANVLCTDGMLTPLHFPALTTPARNLSPATAPLDPGATLELVAPPELRARGPQTAEDEALRARLVELLKEHNGNISEVSRVMGKARMQIHRWMKRFNVDPHNPH